MENFKPYLSELLNLHRLLKAKIKPVDMLLVERKVLINMNEENIKNIDVIFELDDTVYESELSRFVDHFKGLGVLNDLNSVKHNIRDDEINTSFFALLYTSIKPIQSTLKHSIRNEFGHLDDDLKKIYAVASVFRVYEQKAFVSLFSKVCDMDGYAIIQRISKNPIPFLSYDMENDTI